MLNSTEHALGTASRAISAVEIFTDESGKFWGNAGAGGLFYAEDTGRLLVQKRSSAVNEPNTWGVWGGAIDSGEKPENALQREVREEAGYRGEYELEAVYVFNSGKFRYNNYIIVVPEEFEPEHSWESSGHKWVSVDDMPSPLHFGLKAALPYFKRAVAQRQRKMAASALRAAADVLARDLNRPDVNKFYVVIPITEDNMQGKKQLKGISKGVLEGVKGISGDSAIIMQWYGIGRNAILAMDTKKTVSLNRLSRIQYKNPEYLVSKGMSALYRIWDKNPDESWSHRSIGQNLVDAMFKGVGGSPKLKRFLQPVNDIMQRFRDAISQMEEGVDLIGEEDVDSVLNLFDGLDSSDIDTLLRRANKAISELKELDSYDESYLGRALTLRLGYISDLHDGWGDRINDYLAEERDGIEWVSEQYDGPIRDRYINGAEKVLSGIREYLYAYDDVNFLKEDVDENHRSTSTLNSLAHTVNYSITSFSYSIGDILAKDRYDIKTVKGLAQRIYKAWTTDPNIDSRGRRSVKEVPFPLFLKLIRNGLEGIGKVYGSEGEWLVKDHKLKVPKGSMLYIREGKKYDDIIEKYDLAKRYKIKRVDDAKLERARTKWYTRRRS